MFTALYNAKAYLEEGRYAQAILIKGNRIVSVGTNEEICSSLERERGNLPVDEIDCSGRTLLPGFNDSHIHFIFSGKQLTEAQITQCTSIEELVNSCSSFLKENPSIAKKGMHAFGWNQELFVEDGRRMLNRHDLDRISTDFPIVLERVCAHIATANTKAIHLLGLTKDSPQYEDGIFSEKACEPLLNILSPPAIDDHEMHFKAAMEHATSLGLTSIQSNDIGVISDDHNAILSMMDDVYARGEGLLRYRHQVYCTSLAQFEERIQDGIFHRKENKDNMHTVGPLKVFKDGSLGGRTALMREDYKDDSGNLGVSVINPEETLAFCRTARDHGIQTLIHAIGDGAIHEVMEAFMATMPTGNPLRNAIVHCQITDPPLLPAS